MSHERSPALPLAFLLGALACDAAAARPLEEPPNIVLILMDDVGTDFLALFDEINPYRADLPYVHGEIGQGDAPANGPGTSNLYVHAPHLEALAQDGVVFLNAYATPVCSPTRAALFTGNYSVRTGMGTIVESGAGGALKEFGDPGFASPTLAELVRSVGYSDVLVGKWHLGRPGPDMSPDGSADALGWASIPERGKWSAWRCQFANLNSPTFPPPQGNYYNYYFNRDHLTHAEVLADPEGVRTEYATVVQLDEALAWCNQQTGPFLCVVGTSATHFPLDAPPVELVSTAEYVDGPTNAFTRHNAMLEALDTKIGDLVDGLDPTLRENTLFVVLGDNGSALRVLQHARLVGMEGPAEGSALELGETYDFLLDAVPARFKATVFEKGIRVPMIVSGAGVIDPGRVSHALVDAVDVFSTIAELAGAPAGDVHGISFVPVLQNVADYATHARQSTYAELFAPLGKTGPGAVYTQRDVGASLVIPGAGRYKIVRELGEPDRLYKLQNPDGSFADPFETIELPYGPLDPEHANYVAVLHHLIDVVASGSHLEPGTCDLATSFCSATDNSTTTVATIRWTGDCSRSAGDFGLFAAPVPDEVGGFFVADSTANGGSGFPMGNGLLCVAGNIVRLPVRKVVDNILADRIVLTDVTVGIPSGSTRTFQAWFRDTAAGGAGFNLSDGLQVTFAP